MHNEWVQYILFLFVLCSGSLPIKQPATITVAIMLSDSITYILYQFISALN